MALRAHFDYIKGMAAQSYPLVLGRRTQRGPSMLSLLSTRLQGRSSSRKSRHREQHRGRSSCHSYKNKHFGVLRGRATGCAYLSSVKNIPNTENLPQSALPTIEKITAAS